MLAESNE
jgi:hypothetical protein